MGTFLVASPADAHGALMWGHMPVPVLSLWSPQNFTPLGEQFHFDIPHFAFHFCLEKHKLENFNCIFLNERGDIFQIKERGKEGDLMISSYTSS